MASGWVPLRVHHPALQAYLQMDFVPGPLSMLEGVEKLPGAMLLHRTRTGTSTIRRYVAAERPPRRSENDAGDVGRFSTLIHEVVKRQLIADVPVGVFLSGGIDSSIVADAVTRVSGRTRTFSVAFDDPSFDERPFFDEVARAIGSDHHTETLTSTIMAELMPRVAAVVSEPLADGSIFPTYFLSRFARQHVKVALSGDGADELFAGYPTHAISRAGTRLALLPRPVRRAALAGAHAILPVSHANLSFDFRIKKLLEGADRDPIAQNQRWLGSFQPEELPGLLTHFDGVCQAALAAALAVTASEGSSPLEALLAVDRRFYLQDGVLVKADRASMASSLEVRVPFLDNEMLAFANGLSADRKIRGKTLKWILRAYARERFSPAIFQRPKKGFGAPLARWFRGELRELVRDTLSPERLRRDGYFRPEAVTDLLDAHQAGRRDHRKRIFNLLMFTLWLDWAREITP
jgi:asparagine synthase (glutamine-hydrolysing)